MPEVKITEETNKAVTEAAAAETSAAVAVAGAADAAAEKNISQAAATTVAAAEGAAALAQVESAKAIQNAGQEINETKGDVSWLKTHAARAEDFFQKTTVETETLRGAVVSLAISQAEFQREVLKRLTPPALPPDQEGQETQIVDPVKENPGGKGAATGGTKDQGGQGKSNQSRKSRVWTTGRRAST